MFERYTEKARRVIFFARFEASQYGSSYIETEHLLLGLWREDYAVRAYLKDTGMDSAVRAEVDRLVHEIESSEKNQEELKSRVRELLELIAKLKG